ncbi:hypothetical protein MKEN_01158200 [Mycena kentingensis (nom. inval.)]|nr:hypothetical protein MKEN_01158200 [Mycena kentingensis (nom. inval.)]
MASTTTPTTASGASRRTTRATKGRSEEPASPPLQLTLPSRQRKAFTPAEDDVLIRHLATLCKIDWDKQETMERVAKDPDSGTHSAQSWRDRFRRQKANFAQRVAEYRKREDLEAPRARSVAAPATTRPRPPLMAFNDSSAIFDPTAAFEFTGRYLKNPRPISLDDTAIAMGLALAELAKAHSVSVDEAHDAWDEAGPSGLRGADLILRNKERAAAVAAAATVLEAAPQISTPCALPTPAASDYGGEEADVGGTEVTVAEDVERAAAVTAGQKRKFCELAVAHNQLGQEAGSDACTELRAEAPAVQGDGEKSRKKSRRGEESVEASLASAQTASAGSVVPDADTGITATSQQEDAPQAWMFPRISEISLANDDERAEVFPWTVLENCNAANT